RYPACGTAPPRGTGVLLSALSVYQAALGARMAESSSGNNGMLYMIVGALVVVVAVGAFIMFGGHMPGQSDSKTMSIKVEVPSLDKK
ncbi:MAG: hypothetical protein PSV46_04330, partial [Reyranella sp.]|nr:hypothetical protein [Reyranella sp.]